MLGVLLAILGMAFLLGLRHATDADHVVAVSTIVARHRSLARAAWVGALWGLGHAVTVLAVGVVLVVAKVAIPARVGLTFEFGVAVMLVVLGVVNLAGARGGPGRDARSVPPFIVGVAHGLAGSAGATLLVLSIIPNSRWALAALTVFCVGTIAGMVVTTVAIAAPAVYASSHVAHVQRYARLASGAFSICFGLYLAHRVGFVDGLFTSAVAGTRG